MSELTKNFLAEFHDFETRHIYAENFLNTFIATQLKVLREECEWTQQQLAAETGMKQERISVLEDVNYDSWSLKTLKRFARAFDLRLSVKFESFGSFITEYDRFSRKTLSRTPFKRDPVFHAESASAPMPSRDTSENATVLIQQKTEPITVQPKPSVRSPYMKGRAADPYRILLEKEVS
ncbi:MAG TPA: helix-turn-helix transcriptional regulator [Pyrinomonadaceae bacterium]|nr:helix-turn-helix transcriptional regulator [Pyrinomonadaceae bacterium]